MIGKLTAAIYDLDSTLCDTRHRWHLAPQEGNSYTWLDYAGACERDGVIRGTAERMKLDWQHHEVHISSGRSSLAYGKTQNWLEANGLAPWYDYLTLRRSIKDERANALIKIEYIRDVEARGLRVVMVYEDHPAVAREIIAATGLPVLGVNPLYEEDDYRSVERQAGLKADAQGGGL